MIERRGKWQFFSEFLNFFFYYFQSAFFCCCFSANFSSQDLCGFEEEGRENITVLDIIHIQFYDSFPYILILTLLFFILELIVSFKYISCAKRHEGDIKNRNLQYKFFFFLLLLAMYDIRYTFFIFSGAHTDIESRYAYASSPMCFVSLSTEVELFFSFAYCR